MPIRMVRRYADRDEVLDGARPRPANTDGTQTRSQSAILDLQGKAGNRSVAALLAGGGPEALRVAVQREAGASPVAEEEAQGSAAAMTMAIPELDLETPATSFSLPIPHQTRKEGTTTPHEATVTIPPDHADPRLATALASGQHLPVVVVALGRVTYTMRDVILSRYAVSSTQVTIGLDFATINIGQP